MKAKKKLTVDMHGFADRMREQLRAQGIKLPGHASASLERTRRALWQLRATGILQSRSLEGINRRYLALVARVIRRYRGNIV